MSKYKVFISSVQSEFSQERQLVFDFIRNDELMGQYFEPFIFEQIAAQDANPRQLYLDEASSCQVYLLLVGKRYGNLLADGISPTEKEYQAAGEGNAWRVAFISDLDGQQRDLAPEIDLSAEFITTIWRDNDATNIGTDLGTNDATNNDANGLINNSYSTTNDATNGATNDATPKDYLVANKRIIDRKVARKVKKRMTEQQLKECIIEACYVEHSVEELAKLMKKSESHIRNRFITNLVADGILLRTKPEHSPGQTYMTNPKLDK